MLDVNIQYRKEGSEEHESFTMKLKAMPSVGDFIQYEGEKALEVKRVYHIPKEIKEQSNGDKADAVIFIEFVEDLSISDF